MVPFQRKIKYTRSLLEAKNPFVRTRNISIIRPHYLYNDISLGTDRSRYELLDSGFPEFAVHRKTINQFQFPATPSLLFVKIQHQEQIDQDNYIDLA